MQLQFIKAIPHPEGNRVDLQWFNPQPDLFAGVRIMRRETTHPVSPNDGVLVTEKENTLLFSVHLKDNQNTNTVNVIEKLDKKNLPPELLAYFLNHKNVLSMHAVVSVIETGSRWEIKDKNHVYLIIEKNGILEVYGMTLLTDQGLRSEKVYYYTFFPYKNNPREYLFHQSNRVSAMATGPYDFAGQLYQMLPTIYHRYDKILPAKNSAGIPGEDKQKGQLCRFLDLPGTQLDQIYSFAAAALDLHNIDRVDGKLLPLLGQWIGWITDYNLEIAGQRNELKKAPALYRTVGIIPAIEAAIVKCIGGWKSRTKEFVHNVFLSNSPERMNLWLCHWDESKGWQESNDVFSLDFAYEGRPAAVRDENGSIWLFYHTQRNGRWDIWLKVGKKTFEKKGETNEEKWEWTPSQPLFTGNTKTIDKHPSTALQDTTLWVFWNSYDPGTRTWGIQCRQRTNGHWYDNKIDVKEIQNNEENKDKLPVTGNQRKSPQAVVDHNNLLWLFWLEKVGTRWQMKYNKYNEGAWEFQPSADFPIDDDGTEPRVEKNLFVLFHSKGQSDNKCIWVFWSQKKLEANGLRGCWQIAYRKRSLDPAIEDQWGPIQTLPKVTSTQDETGEYDDCEPAAIVNPDNEIELYWASNRTGRSWAVWNINLTDIDTPGLHSAKIPVNNPYTQRAPLPLSIDSSISLVYRSNRSLSYQSDLYRATQTTDFRYAGCVTVDTRNKARNAVQGMYDDFQTYTYDTGENGKSSNNDWYARDTIGLYLTPDTDDLRLITKNQEVIKGILNRFLPIQNRTIFIIEPPIYKEMIYTYDFPGEKAQRLIKEQFFDSNIPEVYPGVSDTYEDRAPEWTWLCSWSEQSPAHHSVDFSKTEVTTKFRTWHIGIKGNKKDE